jgi:PAS domain S-box-containing protein
LPHEEARLNQAGSFFSIYYLKLPLPEPMASIRDLSCEQRLLLFAQQARHYAFIMFDPAGIIVEWSAGAEHIMGWRADEVHGKFGGIIFTPEECAAGIPETELETARQYGEAADVRWHMRKDGSRLFADGVLSAIKDESGNIIGFGKVLRDLTARKELSDYLARQASLLDLSFDPAFSWDIGMDRIMYWNQGAEELYGYRASEAVGESPHVLLATDFPELISSIKECLKRTGRWAGTLIHTRKDGTKAHVDSRMVVRTDLGDQPIVLEVNRDVTRQKEDAERLRQLAANLSATNRRQNEFLATLAHELRNPLAPVKTGLDLLRLSAGKAQAVDKVRIMMERQVDHLVHLVNDLLDLARINSGKVELQTTRVVLRDIVLNAVETSLSLIQAKHHDFIVDIPEKPIWLDADPNRLAQVVGNLLNNAAKYTPENGRISLTVRSIDGEAEIAVSDNGIGIPAEAQPYIFDMFTQVGHGLEHAQGGLGVGLNLVQRLVEKHGGTVSVSSAGQNRGSTFCVRLPLHMRGEGRASESQHGSAPSAANQPLRILVADDNQDAAGVLSDLLKLMGHQVKTAPDGRTALQAAQGFRPDLGLLDIGMPGMNGYELAQAIRRSAGLEHVVLAALTGWGTKGDREKSREAGFDFHLTKPVDFETLNGLIAKVEAAPR